MDERLAIYQEVKGFVCPAEFWPALGYEGASRYVGLWWEPAGDEACWSDGRSSFVGADWPAYLALVDHNFPLGHPARWLTGGSETQATMWLVVDRDTERAWLVPSEEAEALLRSQHPVAAPRFPGPLLFSDLEDLTAWLASLRPVPVEEGAIERAMALSSARYEALGAELARRRAAAAG